MQKKVTFSPLLTLESGHRRTSLVYLRCSADTCPVKVLVFEYVKIRKYKSCFECFSIESPHLSTSRLCTSLHELQRDVPFLRSGKKYWWPHRVMHRKDIGREMVLWTDMEVFGIRSTNTAISILCFFEDIERVKKVLIHRVGQIVFSGLALNSISIYPIPLFSLDAFGYRSHKIHHKY